jgi:hypothetical protein
MQTGRKVREKPLVRLDTELREQIKQISERRGCNCNEGLEIIVKLGLAAFDALENLKTN